MADEEKHKSRAVQIGDRISDWTATLFAHPYVQVAVILFCVTWFALGLRADLLTAALSILAITLTQMVLNGQYDREAEAHRRDVAMHAKLDELVIASRRARNEMAGIEDLDEKAIEELKVEAKQVIDDAGEAVGAPEERAVAKKVVDSAVERTKRAGRSKRAPAKPRARPAGKRV